MVVSLFTTLIVPTAAEETTAKSEIGTVESGYKPTGTPITTAEEFANMTDTGTYYLANDIDLSGLDVPYYDKTFKGNFDGNGHSITLNGYSAFSSVERESDSWAKERYIKNLTLKGTVTDYIPYDSQLSTSQTLITTRLQPL